MAEKITLNDEGCRRFILAVLGSACEDFVEYRKLGIITDEGICKEKIKQYGRYSQHPLEIEHLINFFATNVFKAMCHATGFDDEVVKEKIKWKHKVKEEHSLRKTIPGA